jgi:hypothetical protein
MAAQKRTDILAAMKWGLLFAFFPSAYVAVVSLVKGRAPFAAFGLHVPVLVGLYLAGGLVGGAIYALGRPLVRTRSGFALLGICVLTPFSLTIAMVAAWSTGGIDWLLVFSFLLSAVLVGGVSGYLFLGE